MKQISCKTCGILIDKTSPNRQYCVDCRKQRILAYRRKKYNENPEKGRASCRKWSKINRDVNLEKRRKRYADDPERHIAYVAKWAKNNPEKRKEIRKRWQANNPERFKELKRKSYWRNRDAVREYKERNKEHIKETRKMWVNKNRMHVRRKVLHRKAMKQNAEGSHNAEQFIILCNEFEWKCFYCGCDLDMVSVTEDHMIPLSRGGSDDLFNIVPACSYCNGSKHDKTALEYLKSIQKDIQIA